MDKYIKEYLLQHKKVQVNGLGVFETVYKSAVIHPVLHTVTIPGKYVEFTENSIANTAELTHFIASKEQISDEETTNRIAEWVKNVKDTINLKKEYVLPFGKFLINAMGKMEFIPSLDADISPESFGLEEFTVSVKSTPKPAVPQKPIATFSQKPITTPPQEPVAVAPKPTDFSQKTENITQKEPEKQDKPQKPKRKRSGLLIFLFSILFIVLGLGVYCFLYPETVKTCTEKLESFIFKDKQKQNPTETPKETPSLDDTEIEGVDFQEDTTRPEQPQEDIIKIEEPKPEPIQEEKTVISTGNYYVIIGSFRREANARDFCAKQQSEHPNIINLGKGQNTDLYLIGFGAYTKEDANAQLRNGKSGWWVLKK